MTDFDTDDAYEWDFPSASDPTWSTFIAEFVEGMLVEFLPNVEPETTPTVVGLRLLRDELRRLKEQETA